MVESKIQSVGIRQSGVVEGRGEKNAYCVMMNVRGLVMF